MAMRAEFGKTVLSVPMFAVLANLPDFFFHEATFGKTMTIGTDSTVLVFCSGENSHGR
jgi:hypothetical protein